MKKLLVIGIIFILWGTKVISMMDLVPKRSPVGQFPGNNTAIGDGTLDRLTAAEGNQSNTALGSYSLNQLQQGASNVAAGDNAGYLLKKGSHNIYINNTGTHEESGTIKIGNANNTSCYISGIYKAQSKNKEPKIMIIERDNQISAVTFEEFAKMSKAQK